VSGYKKCNADTFFNKQCLAKNLIPNYAHIKIPTTSQAAHTTQEKISSIRIKEEMFFTHEKRKTQQLLKMHLQAAQEWGNYWNIICNVIHESINKVMNKKYKTINQKLNKLEHTQPLTAEHQETFYPRVINKKKLSSPLMN
jgi:primosomal protein N'